MTENRYIETKVVDSGTEQVTVEQAKTYMSVTSSDYDTLIESLIPVARKRVEDFTHLPLIQKNVTLTVDVCKEIQLPFNCIESITTVEYLQGQNDDGTNDWLELGVTDYQVLGEDAKTIYSNYTGIHRITYLTDEREEAGLILTIKMITNWLFRNRLDEPAAMPQSIFEHAKPFKQMQWG